VVDDEHNTREAMARYLRGRFEVTTAVDGGEAIDMLRRNDFDLMLTDLRMPNADGMSVLEAAANKACRPACVLLTAYGSINDAVAAVKKGAFDFVTKPVKLDKLESVIDAALKSRSDSAGKVPAEAVTAPLEKAPAGPVTDNLVMPGGGAANPMTKVLGVVNRVAATRSTVLISGESGTGKEVIARLIHDRSGRTGYFVPVHCAALTATLLESELFGHEKGAFTGATEQRKGRFEVADGGTLFLDEIGEIDLATQVKLLRVLETRSFERVGGTETISSDVRLVAATNRDLRAMTAAGKFREDLFYRLSVVNIELPPLRDRKCDIPLLTDRFIEEFSGENHREAPEITPEARRLLTEYPWPGNIRELRNTVECMVVLNPGPKLDADSVPENIRHPQLAATPSPTAGVTTIDDAEMQMIEKALRECNGNKTQAAKLLGISRRTLHRKLNGDAPGATEAD
ncbi:MAG: sigma-54 dependent transcriptional regulator, partial [Victivallaceae bacterium]|nr:sigma-54 dependent transcriptional regulator [Victivallaceae bacterium]